MMGWSRIFDISVTLGDESIDYPGDTPYSKKFLSKREDGGGCTLSTLEMSAHSGTHLDAPAHFITNGKTIDQYSLSDFILPALVVDLSGYSVIQRENLLDYDLQEGTAVLFKTENSRRAYNRKGLFTTEYVYLSAGAARFCAEKKVAMVGVDYITIEDYSDTSFTAHKALLSNGVLILEGITLSGVIAGYYVLSCVPLKIQDGEASPVRAYLLKE